MTSPLATAVPRAPIRLEPLRRAPELVWDVPGSKSLTNRALALAALAEGSSVLTGVLHSDDTHHMRRGLEAMGIGIEDAGPTTLVVHGGRERLRPPGGPVFVGNSGTTVRFLAALACLVPGKVALVGDEHMARRPIADLVHGLEQLGATIDCPTGCPPLTITGGALPGGTVRMRGDRSSQYFSAILMAAALADGSVEIQIEGELVSRPYVEMTLRLIEAFGGRADAAGAAGFLVRPVSAYRAGELAIEPDASSASYAFATAAATGGRVTVPRLGTDSLQGDYRFVDVLERMGARVEREPRQTTVAGVAPLHGVTVDMHHISDTAMTLAALAVLAEGETRIENVANIRIKETDRLAATVQELERLGQQVRSGESWLSVAPRPVVPARIECYGDHRMAMSFAVLGLARPGVTITDPACVAKTYPTFWDDLRRVYAAAESEPGF